MGSPCVECHDGYVKVWVGVLGKPTTRQRAVVKPNFCHESAGVRMYGALLLKFSVGICAKIMA